MLELLWWSQTCQWTVLFRQLSWSFPALLSEADTLELRAKVARSKQGFFNRTINYVNMILCQRGIREGLRD